MPTPYSQSRRTTAITNREVERLVETIVATLTGISTQTASQNVKLTGWCVFTPSAETTRVALLVRRGETTESTLVKRIEIEAGVTRERPGQIDIESIDTPGEVANQTYIMTVAQTGATARGTVGSVSLEATIGVN